MRHDTRWEVHFAELVQFMKDTKKRPSRHHVEEHRLLNWIKYNRKQLAKGLLSADRAERFMQLMQQTDDLRRLNQYAYRKSATGELPLFGPEL